MEHRLIEVKDIYKNFGDQRIIDGVSLDINFGDSFGLVGESGSGKTTLARIILKLISSDAGSITYNVKDIRRDCGIVFQDPQTSLNPKIKVGDAIAEPMLIHKIVDSRKSIVEGRVKELLGMVRLPEEYSTRYPHELSGGERQRVGIARAISTKPKFLILDEPISSLDLSVSVKVLDLLRDLKDKLGLTYLFIAHDLAIIKYMCSCVGVMHSGKIVEFGKTLQILNEPKNEYTKKLVRSSLI